MGWPTNPKPDFLDPVQTELLRTLEERFAGWARDLGGQEVTIPPVYEVAELERLDVYRSFPHLAFVVSPLDTERVASALSDGRFTAEELGPARVGLSSAACYGVYLSLAGSSVAPATTLTLNTRCFRNEDHYDGLRRLLSFQVREVVALGAWEHTQDLLAAFSDRIQEFAAALSLDIRKEVATDPFFQADDSRTLLSKLEPVKYEFRVDDLSLSSVNTHRNFFGERCGITVDGGGTAFTSCVGFGLERWVSALTDAHDGDTVAALATARSAIAATV